MNPNPTSFGVREQSTGSEGVATGSKNPTLQSAAGSKAAIRRPNWLPPTLWPFETVLLPLGSSRIAVTEVGKGPVLLFVHTGMWSFVWRDVLSRLAPDFRCICFDAPGCGLSDRLPLERITLENASEVLDSLIRALDLRDVTLVVHDLGGPSGIAGAARVAERIRGICIVNAFAWRPSGAAFRGMLGLMGSAPMRQFDALTQLIPKITSSAFGVGRHMDEASRRAFYCGVGREGTQAFHSYMRSARRSERIYEQLDAAFSGPFRRLPLVTIFGERNDPLKMQPRWREMYPNAKQIVVPKGNHFPMCDNPDLVADTIREFHRNHIGGKLG